ncbi:MAG: glycosyltransferase family 2 protein [Candidatus Kerfeldbacteria bacterium]
MKTQQAAETAVILVNWNGRKFLQSCIDALYKNAGTPFTVVIVDNGSTDGSLEFIRSKYPDVQLIPLKENTGFARGNNIGFESALRNPHIRYIACLNIDTEIRPNWLHHLVQRLEANEKTGMVTSKILFDNPPVIQSTGMFSAPDLGGFHRGTGMKPDEMNEANEVFAPCGASFIVRREVIEECGAFDETLFSYGEDAEWGMRAHLYGWNVMYEPKSVVYHFHSQSSGAMSAFKTYYITRNQLLIAIKLFPWTVLLKKIALLYRRFFAYMQYAGNRKKSAGANAAHSRKLSKPMMILTAMRGYGAAFLLAPTMLRKRRVIYSTRKKSDMKDSMKRFTRDPSVEVRAYLKST